MHDSDLEPVPIDCFRQVMRRFAASVNVITSADGQRQNGMTATAVCSVSAEPPSLLIIVNRTNRSHPIIDRTKRFAVNILASEQEPLARHFASRVDDPFAEVPYRRGQTGCPLIEGADAAMECVVSQQFDLATHTIFVGSIVATEIALAEPLLYHEGCYRVLGAIPTAA